MKINDPVYLAALDRWLEFHLPDVPFPSPGIVAAIKRRRRKAPRLKQPGQRRAYKYEIDAYAALRNLYAMAGLAPPPMPTALLATGEVDIPARNGTAPAPPMLAAPRRIEDA